jgi:hypothetical protein
VSECAFECKIRFCQQERIEVCDKTCWITEEDLKVRQKNMSQLIPLNQANISTYKCWCRRKLKLTSYVCDAWVKGYKSKVVIVHTVKACRGMEL